MEWFDREHRRLTRLIYSFGLMSVACLIGAIYLSVVGKDGYLGVIFAASILFAYLCRSVIVAEKVTFALCMRILSLEERLSDLERANTH
jgi:hypothetical protein